MGGMTSLLWVASIALGQMEGGGGPLVLAPPASCVPLVQRTFARELLRQYEAQYGQLSRPVSGQVPPALTIFPLAGAFGEDIFPYNFVDLQPGSGLLDWNCTNMTYDGHTGDDTDIRSFAEQLIGVPVYAVQDGIVAAVHDGESDMNTAWADQPSNFIIIDHGLGRTGWYWHLRAGSIDVEVGQTVLAGDQIALCGSSGVSSGPHLHFELREEDAVVEPFAGPCRPGPSAWAVQPAVNSSTYLHDFCIMYGTLAGIPAWPYRWPTSGQVAVTDNGVCVWFYGTNLPTNSLWTVRFRRPNGTIVSTGTYFFHNPFWRWFFWWWPYDLPEFHTTVGTWHALLYINDQLMIEAPFEVRTARTSDFNRPPGPIKIELHPSEPNPGEALAAWVAKSAPLGDRDYQVVQFRYVWTVNGAVVRSVTTAAQSDVLSRRHLRSGQVVSCDVTPFDGQAYGLTDSVVATVVDFPVPALSHLGAAAMAVALLTVGAVVLRRRADLRIDSASARPASQEA